MSIALPFLGRTQCRVCPHYCNLDPGETGKCGVRSNINGAIKVSHFGKIAAISVERIEKKPFFHFCPGRKFVTVGLQGCSMSCKFCLNYTVSQKFDSSTRTLSPEELIEGAMYHKEIAGIVFSYNEPTIHFEYVQEVGERIRKSKLPLKVAVKTNGFVDPQHLLDLSKVIDAFNIDIKGNEEDYKEICGARLSDVLLSIEILNGVCDNLEISYLVLPSRVEDKKFHNRICRFLVSVNNLLPVHILNYYPFHEMSSVPGYSVPKLLDVYQIFDNKMRYVYIPNIYRSDVLPYRNTCCRKCDAILVDRTMNTKVLSTSCCGERISLRRS